MQKLTLTLYCFLLCPIILFAQSSFHVAGDGDKYYPVLVSDVAFDLNRAMELEIGRSHVHIDASWWGSVIAKFRFHRDAWGNGSNFIDADIRSYSSGALQPFIGGWHDATTAGGSDIIIWMRGNTTYWYYSSYPITPVVYDNVANMLPYVEPTGHSHSYLTQAHAYVNREGLSSGGTAYFRGGGHNYFQGNLGVGTQPATKLHVAGGGYTNDVAALNQNSTVRIDVANPAISLGVGYNLQDEPVIQAFNNVITSPVNLQLNPYGGNVAIGTVSSHGHKLAVAGGIIAEKVTVKMQTSWPDYVFRPGYVLRSLKDLERFILTHHHLPDVPSEREVQESGIDVADMNAKLLRKVEEQALYIIELNKKLLLLEERINKLDTK